MSTTAPVQTTVATATSSLSDTEWIVIVVVLVLILIVLVIAIAKCLELGKPRGPKSLLQDAQSAHSGTVRSATTRSIASTRVSKKSGKMTKLPLNAEITRHSAGRVSRSAEYGVVIRDIRKTVQGDETESTRMSPPPSYHEQADTLNTYHSTNHTLSSPPNGQLIVNPNQNLAPNNTRAVFAAPDDLYAKPYSHIQHQNSVSAQPHMIQAVQPSQVIIDPRLLNQPTLLMQQ